MIWIIISSFIAAFLLWLLLAPVIIWLNTDTKHYQIALPGIFKAVVVPTAELFHIRGWVFFIPYKFDPFRMKKKKKKKKSDKPVIKKSRSFCAERLAGPGFFICKYRQHPDEGEF
jgi:hypothetical protein